MRDPARSIGRRPTAEPARRPLIALGALSCVAAVTGTLLYTYPETLAVIRRELVLVHDASGDLMIVAVVVYLWIHLRRTWRLGKLRLSWWTGLGSAAVCGVVAGTGIYGQVVPMPSGTGMSVLHAVSGIVLVVLACFHGAYGLRRLLR